MKIDKLALDHFDSSSDFSRSMRLLYESIAVLSQDPSSFDNYDDAFLSNLEGIDEWLLEKGERFNQQIFSKFKNLQDEVTFLREALRNSKPIASPEEQDELIAKIQASINPPLSDKKNPTLDDLFVQWKENNKSNLVASSFKNAYKPAISLFIKFVTDYQGGSVRANELKPEHIHYYQKYYPKIPKGVVASKYSISELIQLEGEEKLPKTVADNFSNIGTFLKWIVAKGYPIDGNLSNVLTKGSDVRLDDKKSKQRLPYTDDELNTLFNSKNYISSARFRTSGMYWAPLIALFTGARMSEILQLECHDIKEIEGAWVIHFDDRNPLSTDNKKRLKKDGSRRIVPIHKQLLALKFIDYVKTQDNRLFPDEPRNKDGKFDAFQKRHTYYRKQLDVKPEHEMELKDFHSFRHTVRTRLTEIRTTGRAIQRFDEGIIDAILGHSSRSRSVGETTYNHSQYITAKKQALNRLQYPSINFKKLVSWRHCDFIRKPYRRSK